MERALLSDAEPFSADRLRRPLNSNADAVAKPLFIESAEQTKTAWNFHAALVSDF